MSLLAAYFTAAIALEHSHLFCPLWRTWGDRRVRSYMLERPTRYVLLPAILVMTALLIGEKVPSIHDPWFRALVYAYFVSNAWHFGTQHYGVARLLGFSVSLRWPLILSTMAIMLLPFLTGSMLALVVLIDVISFIHWLTDIGLTTWRRWGWLLLLLPAGLAGFAFQVVMTNDPHCPAFSTCTAMRGIPLLMAARYALGFLHFDASRLAHGRIGRSLLAA